MRFSFEGLEATRFWLRAFNLQRSVEEAVSMFKQAPAHHDRISFPIVAEYQIEGWGTFAYVILAEADRIGLNGGIGSVYFASPERLEEVMKARDELADHILQSVHERVEVGGMIILEPGKETGRPE